MSFEKINVVLPAWDLKPYISFLSEAFPDGEAQAKDTVRGEPVGTIVEFFADVSNLGVLKEKLEYVSGAPMDDWSDVEAGTYQFVVPV